MALHEPLPLSKEAQVGTGRKKRTGRVRATKAGWRELHAAKGGPCRICGAEQYELHHIVGRSAGGGDTFDNLLPLCGHGNTSGCHGLVERGDKGALLNLAVRLTDGEYSYCIEKLGEGAMGRLFGVMVADGTPPSSARLPNPVGGVSGGY